MECRCAPDHAGAHLDAPAPPLALLGGTRSGSSAAAHPVEQELQDLLDPGVERAPRLVQLLAHLRSCVTRHVAWRRADGALLDHVLVEVRRLVHEDGAGEGRLDASETLLAQVSWWTVNAYYAEPELPHVRGDH